MISALLSLCDAFVRLAVGQCCQKAFQHFRQVPKSKPTDGGQL